MFFRLDALECQENITIGPVIMDGELIIQSNTDTMIRSLVNIDILSFLAAMDSVSYYYFVILTLVFLLFITIAQFGHEYVIQENDGNTDGDNYRIRFWITRRFLSNVWDLYDLVLSQEGNYVQITVTGLLWFLFLIFVVYYTYLIVLLNFMTTEQLNVVTNPKINTVDDWSELVGPEKYRPRALEGFDIVERMRTSDRNSNLGRLWQHMKIDQNYSLINLNLHDRSALFLLIADTTAKMVNMEMVLIERSILYKYVRFITCGLSEYAHFAKTQHVSKPISTGLQVVVMNHNIGEYEKRFINYKLRNHHE